MPRMRMRRRITVAAGIAAAAVLSGATTALAAGAPAKEVDCKITVGLSYLRASYNKGSVGFKPNILCTGPVDSMSLTGQMYVYQRGYAHPVGTPITNRNFNQVRLENKKINVACNGTARTSWFGRATGRFLYGGKTTIRIVDTPPRLLACGAP